MKRTHSTGCSGRRPRSGSRCGTAGWRWRAWRLRSETRAFAQYAATPPGGRAEAVRLAAGLSTCKQRAGQKREGGGTGRRTWTEGRNSQEQHQSRYGTQSMPRAECGSSRLRRQVFPRICRTSPRRRALRLQPANCLRLCGLSSNSNSKTRSCDHQKVSGRTRFARVAGFAVRAKERNSLWPRLATLWIPGWRSRHRRRPVCHPAAIQGASDLVVCMGAVAELLRDGDRLPGPLVPVRSCPRRCLEQVKRTVHSATSAA